MSDSRYSDLDRPPLNERALTRTLVRPGGLWQRIEVVEETGSTNADLAAAAAQGAPEGTVVVAEAQTAGRGRLGRSWSAPPRSGLMFSVLLRPGVPVERQGWIPLLVGTAVAAAVRNSTARARSGPLSTEPHLTADAAPPSGGVVDAVLKWPNDVLAGDRKLAGILAERAGGGVVVGVGLNVSLAPDELPVPTATSLAVESAALTDRETLLRAILRQIDGWYAGWISVGGDPDAQPAAGYPPVHAIPVGETLDGGLRKAYSLLCDTLGRQVRADLPGGEAISGTAAAIDGEGRLVITEGGTDRTVSAGDVVHVRPE